VSNEFSRSMPGVRAATRRSTANPATNVTTTANTTTGSTRHAYQRSRDGVIDQARRAVPRSSSRAISGAPRNSPTAYGSRFMNANTGLACAVWRSKNRRPSASQLGAGVAER
jgi:hypothetical protein